MLQKNIVLDTNSYSNYVSGDNKVRREIQKSKVVYLPLVVIGELYSGYYRGNKFDSNEAILNEFLSDKKVHIYGLTKNAAKIYGNTLSYLSTKGTPITANDVWIAAVAIETDSTLVTYDKHFLKIPNLKVWNNLK